MTTDESKIISTEQEAEAATEAAPEISTETTEGATPETAPETPVEATPEAAQEVPAQAPADVPTEAPADAPAEAQAEVPAEAAPEQPASQPDAPAMDGAVEPEAEPSFAEMMESQDAEPAGPAIKSGDKVTGKVISVTETSVFLDVGAKVDGVVDAAELKGEDGQVTVAEGDELELYVVSATAGSITLSKALSGKGAGSAAMAALEEAYANKVPVEGTVKSTNKGGFEVRIMGKRAFCPYSQMELGPVENPEAMVNETYPFLIIKFEDGKNIVLSRKELLMRERQETAEKFMEELQPGAVLEGTIKSLAQYGVFVELAPGVSGLVHISEMAWSRVDKAEDVVAPGQQVKVKILSVEPGKKKGQIKVSLSMKQAEADPWTTVAERFNPGDKVSGKVLRLADFGAFVEIAPGIEGLVHVSEMSYARRINKPSDVVSVGDEVQVAIKDLDVDRKRLALSIKDAAGDPWAEVPTKYAVGSLVTGTMEKREQFGIFINLEPGVTGLLPKSKIARAEDPSVFDGVNPGDQITVKVEEMDTQARKLTLGPEKSVEGGDWQQYGGPRGRSDDFGGDFGGGRGGRGFGGGGGRRRDEAPKKTVVGDEGGFGSLGDKLQEALKKK